MKFVTALGEAEESTLQEAQRYGPTPRLRQRAQGVLWSAQGYRIGEIARLLSVHRVTVSSWLSQWEQQGLRGLYDSERSGRPAIYSASEQQRLVELVDDEPRRLSVARAQLSRETGKAASAQTAKRILKKTVIDGNGVGVRSRTNAMRRRSVSVSN